MNNLTPMLPFVFIAAVVGIFVVIVVFAVRADKKRTQACEDYARQMGFTYEKKISGTEHLPCSGANLFDRGRSRNCYNYMTGKIADIDILLTDYQYTTGGGKNTTTHTMTVAAYHVPGVNVPDFTLEDENFLTRIAEKFGMQDIDFDTHPVFSKRYRLTGKDENAVRALFTPTLLTSIENGLIRKEWRVQAGDGWLVIHSNGRRIKPVELDSFLNSTFDLANKMTAEMMV